MIKGREVEEGARRGQRAGERQMPALAALKRARAPGTDCRRLSRTLQQFGASAAEAFEEAPRSFRRQLSRGSVFLRISTDEQDNT